MNSHSFIFEIVNCSTLELLIVADDVWGNSEPDTGLGVCTCVGAGTQKPQGILQGGLS